MTTMRAAWGWAHRNGAVGAWPKLRWKPTPAAQHMPSVADVRATVRALEKHPWPRPTIRRVQAVVAIEWMLYTGARPGEVALTELDDVDLIQGLWRVQAGPGSKTGARVVPLSKALREVIQRYLDTYDLPTSGGPIWPPLIERKSLQVRSYGAGRFDTHVMWRRSVDGVRRVSGTWP